MPQFQYGQTTIEWCFEPDAKLKRHYVTVERGQRVLLRGPLIDEEEQQALVRRRARWIRQKLALVNQLQVVNAIVTGSRLRYAGRSYFTEVRCVPGIAQVRLTFTASRFIVENPEGDNIEVNDLMPVLERFYRDRANEKLLSRVRHWERLTGMNTWGARIRYFKSRWASCDANNVLEFHPRVMELAASVQDYVIVHELCHTVEKNHTRKFWALVALHIPDWQRRHQLLERTVFGDAI